MRPPACLAYNMGPDTMYDNALYVHPLMQLEVFNFIQFAKSLGATKVVVFGSSTTRGCNVYSDLDIYVEGVKLSALEMYEPSRDISLDIITPEYFGTTGGPLKAEIERTGLVVYE